MDPAYLAALEESIRRVIEALPEDVGRVGGAVQDEVSVVEERSSSSRHGGGGGGGGGAVGCGGVGFAGPNRGR